MHQCAMLCSNELQTLSTDWPSSLMQLHATCSSGAVISSGRTACAAAPEPIHSMLTCSYTNSTANRNHTMSRQQASASQQLNSSCR